MLDPDDVINTENPSLLCHFRIGNHIFLAELAGLMYIISYLGNSQKFDPQILEHLKSRRRIGIELVLITGVIRNRELARLAMTK